MSDAQDAAAVLAGFQPIDNGDRRVEEFRDAVIEHIAVRPSPAPAPESVEVRLSRVESKLDQLIGLLQGGPPG